MTALINLSRVDSLKKTDQMKLLGVILLFLCVRNGDLFPLDEATRKALIEARKSFDELLLKGCNNVALPLIIAISFPTVSKNWKPDWKLYYRYSYILFDPLSQFPFLFQDDPLRCSLCDRNGDNNCELKNNQLRQTKQWKDGTTARRNPRIIYDVDSIVFLVSKVYKCLSGHNEVPATDPEILRRIPNCYLTFILKHRSGMAKRCVEWVEEKIDAGISLSMIETLIHERYMRDICAKEERFWTDCRFAKEMGLIQGNVMDVPSFKSLYQQNEHYIPTRKLITDVLVANFKRSERKLEKLFSSRNAAWISCDHTFKTAANVGYKRESDGKWITQYKAVF